MPFYCSLTEVPEQLKPGDVINFSYDSNFWMNNWVANQAYNRYDLMIPDIRKVQSELESKYRDGREATDAQLKAWAGQEFFENIVKETGDHFLIKD